MKNAAYPCGIAALVALAVPSLGFAGWERCGPPGVRGIGSFSIAPDDARKILVTGYGRSIDDPGAWRTDDGGRTWSEWTLGGPDKKVPDLVATGHDGRSFAVRGLELFASGAAATWTYLSHVRDPDIGLEPVSVLCLEAAAGALFAGVGNQRSKQTGALLRSGDGGQTWVAFPELVGLAVYDVLPLDVRVETILVATHGGVFRTRDSGRSWDHVGPPGVGARIRDLAIAAEDGRVFAATSGDGVWRSDDRGESWVASGTGLESPAVYSVAADPVSRATIWAGTSGGGLFRSTDRGSTWRRSLDGLTKTTSVWGITFFPDAGGGAVIGTNDGLRCRVEDGATRP